MASEEKIRIIGSAYDRLEESHWNIHQMEMYYHESDPFRYSLNSFLRVLKEVPQILQMELQNYEGFTEWYKERREATLRNPLVADLFKKRDIVVHKSMLKPKSTAVLGITEGRGIKLGLGLPLNPMQDSDVLIIHYLKVQLEAGNDFLGILEDDEDSLPCIERQWRLDPFDSGVLELASQAWEQIGLLVSDTLVWLGGEPMNMNLRCIHSSSHVGRRLYSREWIIRAFEALREGEDENLTLHNLKEARYK